MKIELCLFAVVSAFAAVAAQGNGVSAVNVAAKIPQPLSVTKAFGLAGERMDACVRNQMSRKDCAYLASPFQWKGENASWEVLEPGIWQNEFWGKYMHAAVPLADYCRDEGWKRRIGESVAAVIASQLPDGYIGNYKESVRSSVCDVWGAKYVMLGLMHWYDSTGDKASLEAAKRLCGWVMSKFGPGRRSLAAEGPFNGLMNCSVLEPVVWLWRRTGDRKYLDFAGWIVEDLDKNPEGPEIFRFAEQKTPLAKCKPEKSGAKSYEKMSCCQGILDYYEETCDRRLLDAVVAIASQVADEEIDISGGGTQYERFCGFAKMQTEDRAVASELCVVVTWMRLCGKLLSLTDDSRWADEIEKSFYNVYLAALSRDGSWFNSYGTLGGMRTRYFVRQCRMKANCCDSNGARGFLAFFEPAVMSSGNSIWVNQYICGTTSVKSPCVTVDQFNDYPRDLVSSITLSMSSRTSFALNVRIPGWSAKTTVKTSWGEEIVREGGGYVRFEREWSSGDQVKLFFDSDVKRHVIGDRMAYTRGPLLLARDIRFGDGDLSEAFAEADADKFTVTLPPDESMYMAVTGMLSKDGIPPRPVGFCDFASAGNTRDSKSFFASWIPIQR